MPAMVSESETMLSKTLILQSTEINMKCSSETLCTTAQLSVYCVLMFLAGVYYKSNRKNSMNILAQQSQNTLVTETTPFAYPERFH